MAAQVQGIRAFGSENQLESFEMKVAEKLDVIKTNNALMREFIRAGALQGVIYRKDGTVSQSLWNQFELQQNTHSIALGTATTDVIAEILEAKEKAEDELGQFQGQVQRYALIAGKNMFRKLTRHEKTQKAFELFSSTTGYGGAAREDFRKVGFPILTDVEVFSYSKGKWGDTYFLAPDDALLCPVIEGMYQTRNAPADNKLAVNTIGLPEYASTWELEGGKGDVVHGEMSTVSYVQRPRSIIKITSTN